MATPTIGFAALQIIPSMQGVAASLSGQLAGPSATAGAKAGGLFAGGFGSILKKGLIGGAVIAGIGVGLNKIATSFDDAFDTIRVGTGATGEALSGLQGSFKNVVSSVPTDFASASTAIADLNTRLGVSGPQLEAVSKQMLELSRLTKTDVGANIETVTRVFGDWGVSVEEQTSKLDALFRASQATGPSVDQIGQAMVKFGSPLRQLGFDFDTTAALIGKFEKEGVNTELVLGSMRIALGKMARAGEPAEETLTRITEQIQTAGSVSEANALALELFGARAGPDMAAAIREGRFELGDLLDTVKGGSETILDAAADTNDWQQSWLLLKNRVLVALQPIATKFFDLLGKGMDLLGPLMDRAILGFQAFGAAVRGEGVTSDGFIGTMERLGVAVRDLVDRSLESFRRFWAENGPAIQGAIATLAAVVTDVLLPAFTTMVTYVLENVLPALVGIVSWITENEPVLIALGALFGVYMVAKLVAWTVATWNLVAALAAQAIATLIAYGPVILLIAAVGLLALGLIWAYNESETFRGVVDALAVALETADRWARNITEAVDGFKESVSDALGPLGTLLEQLGRLNNLRPSSLLGKIPGVGGLIDGLNPTKGVPLIPFLAHGGRALAGMPHIVGEEGPELFVPGQTGTVIPNHMLSNASITPGGATRLEVSMAPGAEQGALGWFMRYLRINPATRAQLKGMVT